jgi:FdhD protein
VSGRRPARAAQVGVAVERKGEAPAAPRAPVERDMVVVEEPLEVRVGERSLLITMRTPGDDLDLVRGLMWTEGLVRSPEDIAALAHCDDVPAEAAGNVVTVSLRAGATLVEENAVRAGLVSSACGVCGKSTLAAVASQAPPVGPGPALSVALVAGLPGALRGGQSLFESTGGLHAAALFDAGGRRLALAEDVGRHNAVDKVIGQVLRFLRPPLSDTLLAVSGRAGFEIVHKARCAGIPVVASVSAPSSLSLDLAQDGGQSLIGFLRDGHFNVYCGGGRFDLPLAGAPGGAGR